MVYDDYREDKEFSKQISSSLHSLLLVQRVDCNISGMTVNSSLHSRRQSMIGLRHRESHTTQHNARASVNTRARKERKIKVGPDLGNADDEISELGVVTGLLLEPVGDWFARGSQSECC